MPVSPQHGSSGPYAVAPHTSGCACLCDDPSLPASFCADAVSPRGPAVIVLAHPVARRLRAMVSVEGAWWERLWVALWARRCEEVGLV